MTGSRKLVPSGPPAAKVRELLAMGWSINDVARTAGVSPDAVSRLVRETDRDGRPIARTTDSTASAVLAIDPRARKYLPGTRCPAERAKAIVAAYRERGLTRAQIANECGLSVPTVSVLGRRNMLRAKTVAQIVSAVPRLEAAAQAGR